MFAIAIHGGAGTLAGSKTSPEHDRAYREGLDAALDAGYSVLARGGSSRDGAIAAVCVL